MKINKNYWACKVQKKTLGIDCERYAGFCPFFWMTFVCILIYPFVTTTEELNKKAK